MSEISDLIVNLLATMDQEEAETFVTGLADEAKKRSEPEQPPAPDHSAVQADFASAKAELGKRYRGSAFIDQVNNLRRQYRTRFPGVAFDGVAAQPQPGRSVPQLTDEQHEELRQQYLKDLQAAPASLKANVLRQYKQKGLRTQ